MSEVLSPMMQLRLGYLYILTKSWADPAIKEQIVNKDDIIGYLQEQVPGFKSTWPYLKFQVKESKDQLTWTPEFTQGWSGPVDWVEMVLPPKPNIEANQLAHALAQYYLLFPTPFGPTSRVNANDSNLGMTNPNLGDTNEDLVNLGGVILRAISMAWSNPEFEKELLDVSKPTEEGGLGDATSVLIEYLGWVNEFNTKFRFRQATEDEFKYEWNSAPGAIGWSNIPQTILGAWYPEPPTPSDAQPIALTVFNESGPNYPFTCC